MTLKEFLLFILIICSCYGGWLSHHWVYWALGGQESHCRPTKGKLPKGQFCGSECSKTFRFQFLFIGAHNWVWILKSAETHQLPLSNKKTQHPKLELEFKTAQWLWSLFHISKYLAQGNTIEFTRCAVLISMPNGNRVALKIWPLVNNRRQGIYL